MITKIVSYLKILIIEMERIIDHAWRSVTGLPRNDRSMITPFLYVGGQYKIRAIGKLKRLGITAIVNMRINNITDNLEIKQFHLLHLPTPDQHAPTIDNLKKGIDFIDKEIKNGGKVYVHCKYGEGRGPTMTIAYLISTGITLEDAVKHVRKVRTFIKPTVDQIKRLAEIEKIYIKTK